MNRNLTILIVSLALAVSAAARPLSGAARNKLDNDIRYLVSQHRYHGEISVAVVDASGPVSQVNGNKAFPLASVFKLPLLLAILDGQDKGTFPKSNTRLTVSLSDQCIGSGRLADRGVGATTTVEKASKLMMSISDNTATDLLFRKFGRKNLDPWLRKLNLNSSEIVLTNRQAWLLSLGKVPGWGATSPETRVSRWKKLDRSGHLALGRKIENAARNMSLSRFQAIEDASTGRQSEYQDNLLAARLDNKMSALDLANLLMALEKGKILTPLARKKAFQILSGQKYHTRLPKNLSPSSEFLHKTGTLSGVRNDAGILYAKNGNAGVAIVFLSQNVKPGSGRKVDGLAARIAKLVERAYSKS